jgi:hypothetical protein
LLPHTVVRRQPANISESVASGVACTKSQSDPNFLRILALKPETLSNDRLGAVMA